MTRDQAKKIAEAIFDKVESEGIQTKDLVADVIFDQWHRQTADAYRSKVIAYASQPSERPTYVMMADGLGWHEYLPHVPTGSVIHAAMAQTIIQPED